MGSAPPPLETSSGSAPGQYLKFHGIASSTIVSQPPVHTKETMHLGSLMYCRLVYDEVGIIHAFRS